MNYLKINRKCKPETCSSAYAWQMIVSCTNNFIKINRLKISLEIKIKFIFSQSPGKS